MLCSLIAGAQGGSGRNAMNANYSGTNSGDIELVETSGGAKDTLAANILMNAGSTGTVGKASITRVTATGSTPKARFTVFRGADSTSTTGITAQLSASSRKSVTVHTGNVMTQSSGKDTTI